MYVRWRTYHRKKQPQCLTLCAYLYQTVRIEGRPKAIALAYLGSVREVNDPLEQQQFWRNVEAKIAERQWQSGEKEKILAAIASRVPRPVSDSEKLVTAIERQIAAGVTTTELVERLDEQGITRLSAEVKVLRREVERLKQSLAANALVASTKRNKKPEKSKEFWRVKERLQYLGKVADGHQIEVISQMVLATYLAKYQSYPPSQLDKEQGKYEDAYPVADLEMLDNAIHKVLAIERE